MITVILTAITCFIIGYLYSRKDVILRKAKLVYFYTYAELEHLPFPENADARNKALAWGKEDLLKDGYWNEDLIFNWTKHFHNLGYGSITLHYTYPDHADATSYVTSDAVDFSLVISRCAVSTDRDLIFEAIRLGKCELSGQVIQGSGARKSADDEPELVSLNYLMADLGLSEAEVMKLTPALNRMKINAVEELNKICYKLKFELDKAYRVQTTEQNVVEYLNSNEFKFDKYGNRLKY